MEKQIIGKKIKFIRESNGFSMDKLKDEFNLKFKTSISKSMISNWENGKYMPMIGNLQMYCDYFDVPITYFFDDNIEPNDLEELKFITDTKDKSKLILNADNFSKNWKSKALRNEVNDEIFFIHEKLNLLGLLRVLQYSEDISKVKEYQIKDKE